MSYKTYFHCYKCQKSFIGKLNLIERNGHLYCDDCEKTVSVASHTIYEVKFLTKRGLNKRTSIANMPEEEVATYVMHKYNAKEILSVEPEVITG